MFRKLFALVMIFVGVSLTACASTGRRQATVAPPSPVVQQSVVLATPDCFEVSFLGQSVTEAFSNTCNVPAQVVVEDDASGRAVCQAIVRPGGKRMGPAIWAHSSPDGDKGWIVHGTYIVTATNDANTVGAVARTVMHMEYQRNFGWRFICAEGGR